MKFHKVISYTILATIGVLGVGQTWAADKNNVLNFDADIIQGERKRPDLFIQLGGATTNMEAVLYGRQNFNDFHAVDQVLRPSFYELTKAKPKITPRTGK